MKELIFKQVYRKIKSDENRDSLIRAMDAIDHLKWNLPKGVKKAKWARLDIDTSGRDALKAATNVFAAFLPTWDVAPRGPGDKVFAEQIERWIEWCFMRMNDRGESTVTWDVMKSAAKFDTVVARVDYLPYIIVGEPTKRQKMALRDGPFAVRVFHPLNVHYEISRWGLEWAADWAVYDAEEVLSHWRVYANPNDKEKGGAQVARAIKKIERYIKDAGAEGQAKLAVLDYTDLDTRYVMAVKAEKEVADPELLLAQGKDMIVILDIDNELPFNSWVISVGGTSFEQGSEFKIDPLLAPLHRANLWSNQNLHESLQTSKVLRRFGFPDLIVYTATGERKRVDMSGESNVLSLKKGQEEAEAIVAPPADPGLATIVDRGRSRITSTTGVKVLQDMDISGNLQFATVQMLMQMALGQLSPYKNVAEKALSLIGQRMLEWIVFLGDNVPAFYMSDYGKTPDRKRGAQITLKPENIDLEVVEVKCSLKANTPTDKQQRVNTAVMANKQLNVPLADLQEDLGYGAPEVLRDGFMKEQITFTVLQSFLQEMQARVLMKLQAAQGITKTPGKVPEKKGITPPSQENVSGPGFDQSAGGGSPLGASTDLTRELVTGRSATGQERPGMP